jgi:hypothetical protein
VQIYAARGRIGAAGCRNAYLVLPGMGPAPNPASWLPAYGGLKIPRMAEVRP